MENQDLTMSDDNVFDLTKTPNPAPVAAKSSPTIIPTAVSTPHKVHPLLIIILIGAIVLVGVSSIMFLNNSNKTTSTISIADITPTSEIISTTSPTGNSNDDLEKDLTAVNDSITSVDNYTKDIDNSLNQPTLNLDY